MCDWHKEQARILTGAQTPRDACEKLRRLLVYCMGKGDRLVINTDKVMPNFKTDFNFAPELWPSEEIFDYKKWRSDECYMKVVKRSENTDNDLTPERFEMDPNFLIVYLITYTNNSDVREAMARLPHSKDMAKYMLTL